MNIKTCLDLSEKKLQKAKIKTAALDSLLILDFVLKKPKEYILAHKEKELTEKQKKQFFALAKLRSNHYPLAYILGRKEFFGYEFIVSKSVLTPRPETEKIVKLALNFIAKNKKKNWTILDLGTGSGCIAITLAKELEKRKIAYQIIANDISGKALSVAKQNKRKLNTKSIVFIKSDLFKNIKGKFDLILANLPYVPQKEIKNELMYEPKIALKDQGQIKKFLKQAPNYLRPNGLIIYEIYKGKTKILKI